MMEQFRERKNIHRRYAFQIVLWVRPAPVCSSSCCVAAHSHWGCLTGAFGHQSLWKPDAAIENSMLEAPHPDSAG